MVLLWMAMEGTRSAGDSWFLRTFQIRWALYMGSGRTVSEHSGGPKKSHWQRGPSISGCFYRNEMSLG